MGFMSLLPLAAARKLATHRRRGPEAKAASATHCQLTHLLSRLSAVSFSVGSQSLGNPGEAEHHFAMKVNRVPG